MARYEVVIRSYLSFSDASPLAEPSSHPLAIRYGGLEFVWHPNGPDANGNWPDWPTITVVVADGNDYSGEMLATNRFLSALSYHYEEPFSVLYGGATGFRKKMDRATFYQGGRTPGVKIVPAPTELLVLPEPRLQLVLALWREAEGSDSPFYRFLAFWNALDASFDGDEPTRDDFICNWMRGQPSPPADSATDWPGYLRDSVRNAIAHAVRPIGRPILDPDLPPDRLRLTEDAHTVATIARARVEARWPSAVRVVY